jgi:UDPglucose 6-dehydrogenase
VAVWGLAYKADTHSTKNSASLEFLRALPGYRVRAHDPAAQIDLAELSHVTVLDSPLAAADGADALVVMTPWRSYASISPKELQNRLRGRVIIDPYAVLDETACRALGFDYHRLGA